LADNNGARADNHDRLDIGTLWHRWPLYVQIVLRYRDGTSRCKRFGPAPYFYSIDFQIEHIPVTLEWAT